MMKSKQMNGVDDRILVALDPAENDPGYWSGFRLSVMEQAQFELARRREEVRLTISRLLFGWSRTVVPATLAAAAMAGLMLVGADARDANPSALPLVDIVAAGAPVDPFAEMTLPVVEPLEEGVPSLILVAWEEGY